MDIPQLLQAAKSDLDRLKEIYERYEPDTDIIEYSKQDRREVKGLQANIRIYEGALRLRRPSADKNGARCSPLRLLLPPFPAELEFPLDRLADEIHADFFRFLKNGRDALKRPLWELHGRSLMPQLFAPHAGRNNPFRAHCHFVGLDVLTGIVGPNI